MNRYKAQVIWVASAKAASTARDLTHEFCSNGTSGGLLRFYPEMSVSAVVAPTKRSIHTIRQELHKINCINKGTFLTNSQFIVSKAFKKIEGTNLSVYSTLSKHPRPSGGAGPLFLQVAANQADSYMHSSKDFDSPLMA